VAAELDARRAFGPNTAVLHASGSLPAAALRLNAPSAASVAGAHPLWSFGRGEQGAQACRQASWFLEGEEAAVAAARSAVSAFGAQSFALSAAHRALYHAGAVLASNAITALLAVSTELLAQAGVPRDAAHTALVSLARGAVNNAGEVGAAAALTGPVVRGDAAVIASHREALALHGAQHLALYDALTRATLELANSASPETEGRRRIAEILGIANKRT
jgi:predicted short-subunit dehydrogenase-like oxidoreductase (DUF2520 family)